jgi:hypothetical protein
MFDIPVEPNLLQWRLSLTHLTVPTEGSQVVDPLTDGVSFCEIDATITTGVYQEIL